MTKHLLRAALLAIGLSVAFSSAASAQGMGLRQRNAVIVTQSGTANEAAIVQAGQGNTAALGQAGANNSGSVTQIGNNSTGCLYQHGRNLSGGITTFGDGQTVSYIQTRSGMRPVLVEVCMAQVAAGSPRDIVIPSNVRVRPGR
ncbi:MAG: hypothetical protein R3C30_09955 [Hyphomonadaceae bacterium]